MTLPPRLTRWTITRLVSALAGTLILISIALSVAVSPWWLILAALVAANLLLYSAVGWCPATLLMRRFGFTDTPSCPTS
ncbi:YgaP-like transmembrane domain [Nocardia brasiliensis]|uniref:YgaP-like transmembrane domain n=1 Tax=Nocardia brasiliensis TaxID=37326 RepID=UPI0024555C7A|nr:YgaP-like transmembrane domain [Nocardia brasiliensis]